MFFHVICDVGVIRSAAAHENFVDVAGGISSVMVDNGMSGNSSDRCDDVVRSQTSCNTLLAEILGHVVSESFSSGGLGDVVREVGVLKNFVEEIFVDFSGFAHFTVFVVFLFAVGEVADCTVDEDVSWTSIEVVACSNTPKFMVRNEANLKVSNC